MFLSELPFWKTLDSLIFFDKWKDKIWNSLGAIHSLLEPVYESLPKQLNIIQESQDPPKWTYKTRNHHLEMENDSFKSPKESQNLK